MTAKKTKHTRSPWHRGSGANTGKGYAICSGPHIIAIVLGLGYPLGKGFHPVSEANADLIAAAPETAAERDHLRETLKALIDKLDVLGGCNEQDLDETSGLPEIIAARAALDNPGIATPGEVIADRDGNADEAGAEQNRHISTTLGALLAFAKSANPTFTWRDVAAILAPHYHAKMTLPDVVEVLLTAYQDALSEPRFEIGHGGGKAAAVLLAPVKGFHAVEWPSPKSVGSAYSVEQFYNAMIAEMMSDLRLTRVDWMSTELSFAASRAFQDNAKVSQESSLDGDESHQDRIAAARAQRRRRLFAIANGA